MISFLSALFLAFLCCCPVCFATEIAPPEDFTPDSTFSESFDGEKVQSNVTTNVFVQLPDVVATPSEPDSDSSVSDLLLSPVTFTSALAEAVPAAPNSFKALMISFLGEYQPLSIIQTDSNGSTTVAVPDGVSGLDWPWIAGAVAFLLCIYSLFRILGVLLR